jgi:hypothetical protein
LLALNYTTLENKEFSNILDDVVANAPETVMDLQGIYPAHLIPQFMLNLSKFYMDTYNDLFFVNHPPFFQAFMWSELLYQAPVGIWAIFNLLKGTAQELRSLH